MKSVTYDLLYIILAAVGLFNWFNPAVRDGSLPDSETPDVSIPDIRRADG